MVKLVRKVPKQTTTEMAQPRHKHVSLTIPISDDHSTDPVVVMFNTKTTFGKIETNRSIAMADEIKPTSTRIFKLVYLPDSNNSQQLRNQEEADLQEFANLVANKYSNGDNDVRENIINAIITCYNDVVVNHQALSQARIQHDFVHVTWDSAQRRFIPTQIQN